MNKRVGYWLGKHHTKATKLKISKAFRGKNHPLFGIHWSLAARKRHSKVMKGMLVGNKNPFFGKHHSATTRRKMKLHHWSKQGFNSWIKGKTKDTDSRIFRMAQKISKTRKNLFRSGKLKDWTQTNPKAEKLIKMRAKSVWKTIRADNCLCLKGKSWNTGLTVETSPKLKVVGKKISAGIIKAMKRGDWNIKPNGLERRFIHLIKERKWPFKYTGDGRFWVKRMNPDFVVKNKKIAIELFGCYWHNCPLKDASECWKPLDTKPVRIAKYKKAGWKCIVVWEHEFKSLPALERRFIKYE